MYRLQLRPSKLVEEHEFGYVDTSQMIARLAISVCQYFNARIEKKLSEPTSYRSLIISIEILIEDFKARHTEKDECERTRESINSIAFSAKFVKSGF